MASLFSGTPQTATSYVTSSSDTPKWMQDAIYNQIQWAQNIANQPYQNYGKPLVADLNPLQQQAYQNVQSAQGEWAGPLSQIRAGTGSVANATTAGNLDLSQNQYLNPNLATGALQTGQTYLSQSANQNIPGAATGNLNRAMDATEQANQSSVANIQSYMNPYQQSVLDTIAKQGSRNLTENLLPGVSDSFIRAGQFGSGQMGEFGSRALRDTQEAVLQEQSRAAQQGYAQAQQASQADLNRSLQSGAQFADIGETQGQLTAQQAQLLANLGQTQSGVGEAQQRLGLQGSQAVQGAVSQDLSRELSALEQMAQLTQQQQGMRTADNAALEAAGTAQQGLSQRQLDSQYQQYLAQLNYPKQQMDWLSTQVRGLAPITPQTTSSTTQNVGGTYSASPLQQLASGLSVYKGIQNL